MEKRKTLTMDDQTYVLVTMSEYENYLQFLKEEEEDIEAYKRAKESEDDETVPMSEVLGQEKSNIAKIRKARGLSQAELAELIGTTQSHLSRWERGEYAPSAKYVNALKKALNCKLDELFIFQDTE